MSNPILTDTFDYMGKAELAAFLTERGEEFRASATKAELQELCRAAAIVGRLRRRREDHERALRKLRGMDFNYTLPEAVQVIEELIEDAQGLASALGYAQHQLRAARSKSAA